MAAAPFAHHLCIQQFAVNQALQGRKALLLGDVRQPLLVHEGFEAHRFVPLTAQNRFAIDGGHHAIDQLARQGKRSDREKQERAEENDNVSSH